MSLSQGDTPFSGVSSFPTEIMTVQKPGIQNGDSGASCLSLFPERNHPFRRRSLRSRPLLVPTGARTPAPPTPLRGLRGACLTSSLSAAFGSFSPSLPFLKFSSMLFFLSEGGGRRRRKPWLIHRETFPAGVSRLPRGQPAPSVQSVLKRKTCSAETPPPRDGEPLGISCSGEERPRGARWLPPATPRFQRAEVHHHGQVSRLPHKSEGCARPRAPGEMDAYPVSGAGPPTSP